MPLILAPIGRALPKNCIRAIFRPEFSAKTQPLIMQTNDEPSMALLVLQIRRNPGKRDKMPSVAFYPASFLAKTCLFLLPTNDAPSLALLVLRDKMTRSLTGPGGPGTVKRELPSE